MNEEINYTVAELFEMLKKDESWESDQQEREKVANRLYSRMIRE